MNKLINDLQKLDCDDNYIRELVNRNDVQEAIFFASPSLYESIKKFQNCTLSIKEQKRVFYSIVKYITRMSSRCTPFGLFAGCSIASIGNSPTEILLSNENQYKKHIRLDMHFLCNLAFYLAQNTDMSMKSVAAEIANLAENNTQQAQKTAKVSATLMNALHEGLKTNQPFRINFDKDISVIIKINKDGSIAANFIPGDKAVEEYLKMNISTLRQRFDEQELSYSDLSYSRSRRDQEQENKRKNKENSHE